MKMHEKRKKSSPAYVVGLMAFCVVAAHSSSVTSSVCSSGVADPPFLSSTVVDPNVLLMIDNSASMYDLAYDDLEEPGFCNDDSYIGYIYPDTVASWVTGTTYGPNSVVKVSCNDSVGSADYWFRTKTGGTSSGTLCTNRQTCGDDYCKIKTDAGIADWAQIPQNYAGYFEPSSWYEWDVGLGKFKKIIAPATPADACAGAGTEYTNSDVCVVINTGVTPKAVTDFAAKGNLLNWASASKFDIEKDILTGGKYTGTAAAGNVTLIGESRGCLNRRMLRQVAVTSGGSPYYLSLAVQPKNVGTDWTSTLEIFEATSTGFQFNGTACEAAINATQMGQVTNLAGDCLMIGQQNESFENSNAAFNHGFQTCWGYPTTGTGDISRMVQACDKVFEAGVDPQSIETTSSGYVCMGDADTNTGYIGRCVTGFTAAEDPVCEPVPCATATNPITNNATEYCAPDPTDGELTMWDCPAGFKYSQSKGKCAWGNEVRNWIQRSTCTSDPTWAWVNNHDVDLPDNNLAANPDQGCVERAIRDYCADYYDPGVPDPIGPVETLAENQFPNLPAILIGVALNAQLGDPLAAYDIRIHADAEPTGLLHEKRDDGNLRIGLMTFNSPTIGDIAEGTDYECNNLTPHRLYNCGNANKDGGKILANINTGQAHFNDIISKINTIQAKTWTPYAEAYYDAIGYFSQNPSKWLDATVPIPPDPIGFWCQDNHVLILTDGSSTADRHQAMVTFVNTLDPAPAIPGACGNFHGSSYLDDLTNFAWQADASALYGLNSQLDGEDKRNIKTHIVTTGTLRVTGEDECSPDVLLNAAATKGGTSLYAGEDASALENNLRQVFTEMATRSSAGSAASVISSSRGGEGAVYQAIFWRSKPSSDLSSIATVDWAGEVHSLLIDSNGYMYEDTVGDRQLTLPAPPALRDKRVTIYFDNKDLISKGCYAALNSDGTCNAADQVDMDAVRYLWSANDWLAKISHSPVFPPYDINDQYLNRTDSEYISNKRQRYIFTWNDLDNDGIVDPGEKRPFVSKTAPGPATTSWSTMISAGDLVSSNRGPVTKDFNAANDDEVNKIVEWIRGVEVDGLRPRTITKKMNVAGTIADKEVVWRLGDVVHSTPTAVASPMEGLHLLYNDTSYAKFVSRWVNRRHMVYFGANDGMLHAVNSGFYKESDKKFCLTANCQGEDGDVPELGAEMWAYVPYNLLPHLQCLTGSGYGENHKFYVDQRPRVFDARIFNAENACSSDVKDPGCIHPDGWGTVLVGSMRFGGARVEADSLNGNNADKRYFTSSYFLLDITNPEAPPVLLGEYTMLEGAGVDLGFTTPSPTPVVMKSNSGAGEWYLLMGSGPTVIGLDGKFDAAKAIKGFSMQKPKVAVFPLKWLTGWSNELAVSKQAFRIPDTTPTTTNPSGVFTLDSSSNGFISDMITVDYDLKANYMSDAVYFGTVEHGPPNVTASYDDDWDGQLYRLKMRELDAAGEQEATTPDEWLPSSLFNAGQPITTAPTVGTDRYNYWVYFGTGRFFDAGIDKLDNAKQSFYGVKEPTDCTGEFTWPTILKGDLVDVSEILVKKAVSVDLAQLYCLDTRGDLASGNIDNDTCLPSPSGVTVNTLGKLTTHIAGSGRTPGSSCVDTDGDNVVDTQTGEKGWYRDFPMITRPRERNVGQATLLGGLLTFTTYQPFDDECKQEGMAYLYGLYYQTGTAWYKTVFGARGLDGDRVMESISLGRGLATTPNLHVGSGDGPTAFIQTSTGEIIEIPQEPPIGIFKTGRQSWQER